MMNKSESIEIDTEQYCSRRFPAEWEAVEAVMIAWPHRETDWAYMLEDVEECYTSLARAITDTGVRLLVIGPETALSSARKSLATLPQDLILFLPTPTNDTWTRDYGALTVAVRHEGRDEAEEKQPLDFKFNGWGLKFAADKDNLATRSLAGMFRLTPENHLSFVLEGGSLESDGCGTLLTTSACLLSPNRNGGQSREEIEAELRESFGCKRILWLEHGGLTGDDTDSHIDTLARFAPPGDVIFYTGCSDPEDEHFEPLKAMAEELRELRRPDGQPYNLIELPLPDPVYDPEDGSRLPATYANFLFVNDTVLLPVYGQPMKDRQARDTLAVALPEYKIVSVDCRALVRQHGSLHCATMQFPLNTLKI